MKLARRTLLLGGAFCSIAPASNSAPQVLQKKRRRISQGELDEAMEAHEAWLTDGNQGRRAVFTEADLSGLDFRSDQDALLDLRGADFTNADLTGIRANLVSFSYASLHSARLSWSRLKRPSFISATLRYATCDNVTWGWDDRMTPDHSWADKGDGAAFLHADAARSNFERSKIRGFFVDTRFTCANLCEADLSYSMFVGGSGESNSFFETNLSRTIFRSTIIRAARFSTQICDGADFTDALIGYGVKLPIGINVSWDQLEG
jgi:uncharacterized protein YjbI with pentapeptide repeats